MNLHYGKSAVELIISVIFVGKKFSWNIFDHIFPSPSTFQILPTFLPTKVHFLSLSIYNKKKQKNNQITTTTKKKHMNETHKIGSKSK